MTTARWRALILIAVALVGAAAIALTGRGRLEPASTSSEKPTLLLLTSLPLVFGDDFSLEGAGSPALTALREHYRVLPISVASDEELAKGRLLLMAHPLAQPPGALVALDRWVRAGGKLLLLADPLLEWPSPLPLGDPLRPPPMFADTGLLAHWGLRLDAPERRGPQMRQLGGRDVATLSPGSFQGSCEVAADGLVARCPIEKGHVTIVADADLIGPHAGEAMDSNLRALLAELAQLANS